MITFLFSLLAAVVFYISYRQYQKDKQAKAEAVPPLGFRAAPQKKPAYQAFKKFVASQP